MMELFRLFDEEIEELMRGERLIASLTQIYVYCGCGDHRTTGVSRGTYDYDARMM